MQLVTPVMKIKKPLKLTSRNVLVAKMEFPTMKMDYALYAISTIARLKALVEGSG